MSQTGLVLVTSMPASCSPKGVMWCQLVVVVCLVPVSGLLWGIALVRPLSGLTVTILPSTLSFFLCFTLTSILVIATFLCATPPPCPLWQSCLANSFPSAISSFATSSAALGSYAYPIRSHIILVLMSSSPPLCHIALLLPLSLEHSILPLLTDDPVTFYDTPWYSGSCALSSSTFYAFLLLSDASCTFYHVLLPSLWIS